MKLGRLGFALGYLAIAGAIIGLRSVVGGETLRLVSISLAIVALGLCVWRLREVGKPIWLVLLGFIPVLTPLLFVYLCLAKSTRSEPAEP